MKVYLRVKIKSLAAEARVIRHEELKLTGRKRRQAGDHLQPGPMARVGGILPRLRKLQKTEATEAAETLLQGLRRHRTIEVRGEARAALLAMGFLNKRPYRQSTPDAATQYDGLLTIIKGCEAVNSDPPPAIRAKVADLLIRFGGVKKADAPDLVNAWIDG